MLRKHSSQKATVWSNLLGQYNIIEGSIHTEHLVSCTTTVKYVNKKYLQKNCYLLWEKEKKKNNFREINIVDK